MADDQALPEPENTRGAQFDGTAPSYVTVSPTGQIDGLSAPAEPAPSFETAEPVRPVRTAGDPWFEDVPPGAPPHDPPGTPPPAPSHVSMADPAIPEPQDPPPSQIPPVAAKRAIGKDQRVEIMIGLTLAVALLGGLAWWAGGGDSKPQAHAARQQAPGTVASTASSTGGSAPTASPGPRASGSPTLGSSGLASVDSAGSGTTAGAGTATAAGTTPKAGVGPTSGTPGTTSPPPKTAPAAPPPGAGNADSNPYTPAQVCNSGGHGSGYSEQRSSTFSGGTVHQLHNSSGYYCAVTMKTADLGEKTSAWVVLISKDGTTAADQGPRSYYAGPVYTSDRGQCVKYKGGTDGLKTASSSWYNCG